MLVDTDDPATNDGPLWFTKEPHGICESIRVSIDPRRARELSDLFDGDIGGWYYLSAASPDGGDEASKWILGAIAAKLNEIKKSWSHAYRIMPADYLASFVSYLKAGKFERSFAKDVFSELMLHGEVFEAPIELRDDMTPTEVQTWVDDCGPRRLGGNEVMDKIIGMPRFKAVDESELDTIIGDLIKTNPDQVAKARVNPKLVQWFVGQVMKASKGKAPAQTVQAKLAEIFEA